MSAIPKVLYLCYKEKCRVPQGVIDAWTLLNPEYMIKLYGNRECEEYLRTAFNEDYVNFFRWIPSFAGPIKADFWRLCILYKEGGVYVDVDVVPLVPISTFLDANVSICTCSSFRGNRNSVNPHFLACRPGLPCIQRTIHALLSKNRRRFTYWGFSCVWDLCRQLRCSFPSMKNDLEGIYEGNGHKLQLLQEVRPLLYRSSNLKFKNMYCSWAHQRIMLNRSATYDEKRHKFIREASEAPTIHAVDVLTEQHHQTSPSHQTSAEDISNFELVEQDDTTINSMVFECRCYRGFGPLFDHL